MKNIKFISLVFLILLTTSLHAQEKFKVGVILPLTGPAADYGNSIKNCIKLAQKDFPEKFTNIDFLYEDNLLDAKIALTAMKKLSAIDKADLIFTFGSNICRALVPYSQQIKQPFVGLCSARGVFPNNSYAIRFKKSSVEYMKLQLEYLDSLKLNNIGIVLGEHAYIEEVLESLKINLKPNQKVTIVERYNATDANFRSTISKLKKSNFDVVGVFLGFGQVPQFYIQAKEQKLTIPTFGTDLFESLSEVKSAKGAMDQSVFVNSKINSRFRQRYRKVFETSSQLSFGASAYEFASLIGDTFNTEKEYDKKEIISLLYKTPTRDGIAAGPYSFRANTNTGSYFSFPITVKEIVAGDFRDLSF